MFGFEKTYVFPFKYDIPSYTQVFLEEASIFKRLVKFMKRLLYLNLKRQQSLEIRNILPEHRSILWINISAPSLGDSLMDLSSRVLLKGKKVDLFTSKKNASLFENDTVFSNIFSLAKEVNSIKYDLVIVDSYSYRSVYKKALIAPLTSFVGMFGHYNGPEVNRVLFSFHRMNHLLGYIKSKNEVNRVARASIATSINDNSAVQKENLPNNYIAIVLGGEWEYRTYNKWDEVIRQLLIIENNLNIVLVGSANAKKIAMMILDKFPQSNIFNCVSKFTFNQTAQIINKAKLLICCDGGLMHAANSVNTPIVSLFARLTEQLQLTESIHAFTLFDETDVNNIPVENILQRYKEASNYVKSLN